MASWLNLLPFSTTYHSYSIIKQWFTKHQDVQQLIYMNLFKNSEYSNWIHSRDDGAEQQIRQKAYREQISLWDLTNGIQQASDKEGIPQSPHNSKHEDCAEIFHEGSDGQEVASVQDDGGQQAEKEPFGVQHWGDFFSSHFNKTPNQQANDNQQAALWNNTRQARNQMETWKKYNKR